MTVGILGALAAFLGLVREVLRRRNRTRADPSAADQAEAEAHKARTASAQGDAQEVNARMARHRIRKGLSLACLASLAGLAIGGCSLLREAPLPLDPPLRTVPAVVVVAADRWQYPLTNEVGVVGWFVPSAVHVEYVEAVELLDFYRAQLRAERERTK